MSSKVLVIGDYHMEGVDSYDWWQELPNLTDYTKIVLDTTRIFTYLSNTERLKKQSNRCYLLENDITDDDNKIKTNLRLVKRKLLEILGFDVNIYALYYPTIKIEYLTETTRTFTPAMGIPELKVQSKPIRESVEFLKTNDWSPISIETSSEKGKTICIKEESYMQYFKAFKEWDYYFLLNTLDISALENHYDEDVKIVSFPEPIATDNIGNSIAIRLPVLKFNWLYEFYENGKMKKRFFDSKRSPMFHGGELALLPVIDQYNTKSHIEFLLQKIGVFEKTSPPSWVNLIAIPGEDKLKEDLEVKQKEIETLSQTAKEIYGSLTILQGYKGLLYETGISLQELVKITLEKLGMGIEPSTVSDEFIINFKGKRALIEVKGNTKSISKSDIAQLNIDMGVYLKETEEEIEGILVGNGWRLLPLEERDTSDKPIFPYNIVEIAKKSNIGLLSSTELFKAYCQFLGNPACKDSILSKIIEAKGVITF